jgi:DNA-binding MarR family transcriptional regulator
MKKTSRHEEMASQWLAERPDIDPSPNRMIGLLYQLSQQVETEFRNLAQSQFGLGPGDLRILLALRRAGPCRPTDLFQILLISSGAVSKQLHRLADRGLVDRVRDPSHRGGAMLSLTPRGRMISDDAIEAITRRSRIACAMAEQSGTSVATTIKCLRSLLEKYEGE